MASLLPTIILDFDRRKHLYNDCVSAREMIHRDNIGGDPTLKRWCSPTSDNWAGIPILADEICHWME